MNIPDRQYFPFLESDEQLYHTLEAIRKEIGDYIRQYRLSSLVLGISGGIDSALCAVILRPVCDDLNISLIGRSISIETNTLDEESRATAIGNTFCHDFQHLDLTDTFFDFKKHLIRYDNTLLSKLRQGNMKARMRMIMLYDLAQLNKGIVVSTDNYTEFLTGFWTLHGDVGDYAPIINLWKTEVYRLSAYLLQECDARGKEALQDCIDAVPVDGLGVSQSDYEQLGVTNYFEADKLFQEYFMNGDQTLEDHPLIQRFKSSAYKRNNPVYISRSTLINRL